MTQPGDPSPPHHERPSLIQRLVERHRARVAEEVVAPESLPAMEPQPYWLAPLIAALIAAGPLAAWGTIVAQRERVDATLAEVNDASASRVAAWRAAAEGRAALARATDGVGVGEVIEAFAETLPEESRLVSVAYAADGGIEAEVATVDPDRLRAALRRHRLTDGLRETGQRAGDGVLLVRLQGRGR